MWHTSTRKRTRLLLGALVVTALFCASQASAGPWVHELGHGYIKAGVTAFSAEESFNRGVAVGTDFNSVTTNVYGEIGLGNGIQLILDVPYIVATNTASTDIAYRHNTLGDGRFQLDYALIPGLPLALGFEVKVPMYRSVSERDDGGVIDVDGETWPSTLFPEVGDDNIDLTPKVMIGYGLRQWPAWMSLELGYKVRLSGFSDGISAAASVGAFVWPEHIALNLYASGLFNLQDDINPELKASKEFVYVQGSVLITAAPWQPDLGLSLFAGGIPWAQNSSQGMDFGAGISYSF